MTTGVAGALQKAWLILTQRDDKPSQVALAICVIVISGTLGCAAAFLYGVTSRSGGWSSRLMGGFVAILACVGSFSVGGMLGLLFGSPTLGSGQAKADSDSGNVQLGVRPNTSLERVADWLTTMIVGLGLVNLGAIKTEATSMSVWLTEAISGRTSSNGTPGITIALGFSFAGFLLLYLWCMRFLPSELRDSYDALKARAEDAEEKARRLLLEFKERASFVVPKENLGQVRQRLIDAQVEDQVANDVVTRYTLSTRADSEPMLDFGPSKSGGYELGATVSEAGAGKYDVTVQLTVPAGTTAQKVFWLLHNSFSPDVMSECPVKGDAGAQYSTMVDEAFWVGAIVPLSGGQSVRLAISLAAAPNAPPGFVGNA